MAPMSNRLLVPRKTPGLLDLVPGAAAAYSLRSLSNSYADPVVTVRRSSDDAEEDFTASEIADGTLAAFCGAGDGFVYRWWDQSGNARHAVAAADTNEPKIVDSGVVVTEEGKPAIRFDGSNDFFSAGVAGDFNSLHNGNAAVFAVLTIGLSASPAALYLIVGTSSISFTQIGAQIFYDDRSGINENAYRITVQRGVAFTSAGAITHTNAIQPQQQFLLSQIIDIANPVADNRLEGFINSGVRLAGNVETDTGSASNSTSALHIGGIGGTYQYAGYMQELIIYPSDLTEQRELVEGNIAWGWSV